MGGMCSGTPKKHKNDKPGPNQTIESRAVNTQKPIENTNINNNTLNRHSNNLKSVLSENNRNNFDLETNNNNINPNNDNQNNPSNRIIFDTEIVPNINVNNASNNIHNSNINTIRSNLLNFNNVDRNSNNMINISINDELSNRRNNGNYTNNQLEISQNNLIFSSRHSNINRLACERCNLSFLNHLEFDNHLSNCGDMRSNQMIHNINEILHLVQSLNRHLQNEGRFNSISLLGLDEPEDIYDFIDWRYLPEVNSWKQEGKIHVSSEELKKISKTDISNVKKLKFWQKRIWFLNYMNKNVYDKSSDNTTLVVSRNNILEESFNQFITTTDLDLRKSMQIFFVDEAAIDIGGVYREWYSSLFDEIFANKNGFFFKVIESAKGKNSYFIPTDNRNIALNTLDYFEFIGKILGKALFDKITIKGNLNIVLLKLIINQEIELEDLEYIDSGYYHSLKDILKHPMKDLDLNFTWNVTIENEIKTIELVKNGADKILDEQNKFYFVKKVVEFIAYTSIKDKIDSLKKGFFYVIPHEVIEVFKYYELDYLFSGQSEIDINDWKAHTIYRGKYNELHPVIKNFWDAIQELSKDDLFIFYKFCTGNTRIPIDGFNSLQGTRNRYQKFCIESPPIILGNTSSDRLIEANTCFNRIYLPEYETKEQMKNVISKILENDTNYFGKQ